MKTPYDDIINLPRHTSLKRHKMPKIKRAAQFAPFAALAGHEDAVRETARLTNRRIELDDYLKYDISDKLQAIAARIENQPEVTITYFKPDPKKEGGEYLTTSGKVKKIDKYKQVVVMNAELKIPINEIIRISFE